MKLSLALFAFLFLSPHAQAGSCRFANNVRYYFLYIYANGNDLTTKCDYVRATSNDKVWNYTCRDGSTAKYYVGQDRMVHSVNGACTQNPRYL